MKIELAKPKIDKRKLDDLFTGLEIELFQLLKDSYQLEWTPAEGDVGLALLKIYSHMLVEIIQRLNRVPEKNFIAFLDMLGIKLLPAQSAAAPITFILAEGAKEHVFIPAKTQVAAGEIIFETEKNILAAPAKITSLYSVKPRFDAIYYHFQDLNENNSFFPFSGKNLQEHILYLGHKDLFNSTKETKFILKFHPFYSDWARDYLFEWDYWGENQDKEKGWHTLTPSASEEAPEIHLQKSIPGEILEREINGVRSRWIRCKTTAVEKVKEINLDTIQVIDVKGVPVDELPVESIKGVTRELAKKLHDNDIEMVGDLPKQAKLEKIISRENAEKILAEVEKRRAEEYLPDMAYCNNNIPLDVKNMSEDNPVYPFGKIPKIYNTFYIASQEAFSKKNFNITIKFKLAACDALVDGIVLSWEYWDGKGWKIIQDLTDNTNKFTAGNNDGETVEFTCPPDIEKREVAGQENYWIRVRIVGGDYGKEKYIDENNKEHKHIIYVDESHPPKIKSIKITYLSNSNTNNSNEKKGNLSFNGSGSPVNPGGNETPGEDSENNQAQQTSLCIFTYNNLQFKVVSKEWGIVNQAITPFQVLEDQHPTLYLGFDQKMEKGPISLFFSIDEETSSKDNMPEVDWFYYSEEKKEWVLLDRVDHTSNLTASGTVEFLIPRDFVRTSHFGKDLYWIKAVFVKYTRQMYPRIKGIYINTVLAFQFESIKDEILGSSDGSANQAFKFVNTTVMEQEIWVNETSALTEEEKNRIIQETGENFITETKDKTGITKEVWVCWQPVADFLDSSPNDRHYVMDGAMGEITFGSGIDGMIPPIGSDNIKANYRTGGGQQGNLETKEISELKTSLAFVDSITNNQPGQGGSDTEQLSEVLIRGPHLIKHRDKAVTEEDFQRLAREASNYIARTKCLIKDNKLIIIIIPKGQEDKPTPSPGLLRKVKKYLVRRSLNIIHPSSIEVHPPAYVEVKVTVDVVPVSIDLAVPLEDRIMKRLKEFFHPLTGGPEGTGWQFGRDVHISDVYAMLEHIEGVDHVEKLKLEKEAKEETGVNNREKDVIVEEWETVCSGTHDITMRLGG